MRATTRAVTLAALLVLPHQVWGRERGRLADALALQEVLQQVIEQAEPSIACILVSRSEAYRQWGVGPSPDAPGSLGRFDSALLLRNVRDPQQRRSIKDHDLSLPDTVPESYGSGVVLAESGLILTAAHVIRNATKIYVRLPGGKGSWADIHASDPRSDLAVLRLLDPVSGLKALRMGDGGKLRKGHFVIALANPFAVGFRDGSPSASWGIVSNVRRRAPGNPNELERTKITLHHYGTLIQTDTRIDLGCSGGALLNLEGELIGLTTALAALTGTETPGGYAVPLDMGMQRIIEVLLRGEEVEYGFLGVRLRPEGKPGAGVSLLKVESRSPAQRGGLQSDDYILSINGSPVHENDDLFLLVGVCLAGSTIRIEAARTPNGPRRICNVKLAKFYVPGKIIASQRPPARGGLRVDYTSILWQRGGITTWGLGPPEGVIIREVLPGSPADKAQLQVDKVITHVNQHQVTTPTEFYQEMQKATGPIELTVLNSRGLPERVTLESN